MIKAYLLRSVCPEALTASMPIFDWGAYDAEHRFAVVRPEIANAFAEVVNSHG